MDSGGKNGALKVGFFHAPMRFAAERCVFQIAELDQKLMNARTPKGAR